MNFKKLLAILINYHHNFRILHWKLTGRHFDEYHQLTASYYDIIQKHLDLVAEIGLTYKEQPLGLVESFEVLKDDKEGDYKILKPDSDYTDEDVVDNIDIMFTDILEEIKKLTESDKIKNNPGVCSELENMYTFYDIECNYKNKRRQK